MGGFVLELIYADVTSWGFLTALEEKEKYHLIFSASKWTHKGSFSPLAFFRDVGNSFQLF